MIFLIFPLQSWAISVSITSGDSSLGTLAVGDKVSLKFKASGVASTDVAKLKWTVKNVEGYANPGFKFASAKGEEVTLTAEKLKRVKDNNGSFRVNITAKDSKGTATSTISGKVMEKPEISTKKLKAYASKGKEGYSYTQPIELKTGTEPVTWTLSGDLPEGIEFKKITVGKKQVYALTGDTPEAGEYPLEFTAENEVGSDTKKYTFSVIAVKPEFKIPSGIPTEYDFLLNKEIAIDLSKITINGTKPISLDLDSEAKHAGLSLDVTDDGLFLRGTVTEWSAKKMKVQLFARNRFTESTQGKYKPVKTKLTLNLKEPPSNVEAKINSVFRDFTKNYSASFKVKKGTKPITWKFYMIDSSGSYRALDENAFKNIYEVTENGKIKIPKLSTLNEEDHYQSAYIGSYVAVASNKWGTISYDFTVIHGAAPRKIDAKKTKEIMLTNGDIKDLMDKRLGGHSFDCAGFGDIWWDTHKDFRYPDTAFSSANAIHPYQTGSMPTEEYEELVKLLYDDGKRFKLSHSGLPTGASLVDGYNYDDNYICDYYLSGTLKLSGSSSFKKYKVKFEAVNPWGKAKNTMTLDVREPATIDPAATLSTRNSRRVILNKKIKLKIPTKIKKPYTWRLNYNGSNNIKGTIGNSGLAWDPDKATISGTAARVGIYPVTIELDNEISETSKDYRIYILRSLVDIVQEPTGLVFKNDAYDTEDKRSSNATYSSQKYSFNIPLQIVGWPRDKGNVEWKVTGGENLGVTAENISYSSDGTSYATYNLKVSNLDKNAFERLSNAGTETSSKTKTSKDMDTAENKTVTVATWRYKARTLTLNITVDNGFDIASETEGSASITAMVNFADPDGYREGEPPSSSSASDSVSNDGESPDEDSLSDLGSDFRLENLRMRGINDISEKNLALIPSDYEVIAVLPEISVEESGLYEFDVKVSDDIEPDRELKYFAFSSEPDSDDEIVEFYNSDGEEITELPENHELTVDAWFNKEKTYEPVIAVKKTKTEN